MNLKKIQWIFGVLLVFFLILATNLIDQGNFNKIQKSVKTVYEDRLVAQDIVFNLANLINEKDMANAITDSIFYLGRNGYVNATIRELMNDYEQTNLTKEELTNFSEFKQHLIDLKKLELKSFSNNFSLSLSVEAKIKVIKLDLKRLADLQIAEGWRELKVGKKAAKSIKLFTQIEIYILIFLAIVFQILILYTPRKIKKIRNPKSPSA